MRKDEKEILTEQLKKEAAVLQELKEVYQEALAQVEIQIKLLLFEETGSKIYRREYQKLLKAQLEKILQKMDEKQYKSIREYLDDCYFDGYLGTMYSMQQQGVPLAMPIDQKAAAKAIQTDSKLSKGLYGALGVDISRLKRTIAHEISRGVSASDSYSNIARNVDNVSKIGFSNAKRIVITEGHRIQQSATFDAQKAAKACGAEVVKVWDATLDGKTRPTHRKLDGQIREVDELFEMDGKTAMYPGGFGDPAEDCNCRCASLTKAKWNLGENETRWLGRTENMTDEQLRPIAEKLHISVPELRKYGNQIIPVKADSYKDFVQQYNRIWNYENSDHKKTVEAKRREKK